MAGHWPSRKRSVTRHMPVKVGMRERGMAAMSLARKHLREGAATCQLVVGVMSREWGELRQGGGDREREG